jgi:hypothetical protein
VNLIKLYAINNLTHSKTESNGKFDYYWDFKNMKEYEISKDSEYINIYYLTKSFKKWTLKTNVNSSVLNEYKGKSLKEINQLYEQWRKNNG